MKEQLERILAAIQCVNHLTFKVGVSANMMFHLTLFRPPEFSLDADGKLYLVGFEVYVVPNTYDGEFVLMFLK